jgi:hypothetical protein
MLLWRWEIALNLDDQAAGAAVTMTLEAYADTIVPGAKRGADDDAIAGMSPDAGAVSSGALELLRTPATGISAGLDGLATMLNAHARQYAVEIGMTLDGNRPEFVALEFEHRTALVQRLTSPGHPEKSAWVMLALFSYMAFDSAAHVSTVDAFASGHPGLRILGYAPPDDDGLWRFAEFSYGRPLAKPHPNTTSSGSPA